MRDRYDIVISGASFAGLALALALSRAFGADLRIALIDPRLRSGGREGLEGGEDGQSLGERRASPRAFSLSAASRNLLEAIGVWDRLADVAQPVRTIEITDSALEAGVRPVLLTYDNVLSNGEPASFIVPDGDLTRVLSSALFQAAPGVDILGGVTIAGQHDEAAAGGLRLALSDGSSVVASLLVGAEGRASATRERAGIKVVGSDYRQTGICVQVAHEAAHYATAVQHFLPGGPFAILPLRGNRSCITWSETDAVARDVLAMDETDFLAEIERRIGGRLGAVELASERASWPLKVHVARRFVADRVALISDAARGVHPIAGQGLNLGLRDVAALAESVGDAMALGLDPGGAEVLARFERWRRFDSGMSTATFDGLNRLFSNDWPVLRSVREAGLGMVDRLGFVKQGLVAEAAGLTGDVPKLLKGETLA